MILKKLLLLFSLLGISWTLGAKECVNEIKGVMSSDLSNLYKLSELNRLKENCQKFDEYQYSLGVMALKNKKYLTAQKALTSSLLTTNLRLRQATYKQLLELFLEINDKEMAFETVKSFVEQFPESAVARGSYSHILLLRREFRASIQEGVKAYKLSPEPSLRLDMLKLMIISYHKLGEYNNSVISFQKAGEIDKTRLLTSEAAIEFTVKSLVELRYYNEAKELINIHKIQKSGQISKEINELDDYLSTI